MLKQALAYLSVFILGVFAHSLFTGAPSEKPAAISKSHYELGSTSWPLDDGRLRVPRGITHFSMDLGVAHLTETARFLGRSNMFVIAVEANPFVYNFIKYTTSPKNSIGYCKFDADVAMDRCSVGKKKRFATFHASRDRVLLVNAAAGYEQEGYAELNIGRGYDANREKFASTDTSSLLQWDKQEWRDSEESVRVPFLPMQDLLALVPKRLTWDLLKVDIQGADAAAVISTGDYIERFKCVLAEFSFQNKIGMQHYPKTAREFLLDHGFVKVAADFYVNRRFKPAFARRDYTCVVGDLGVYPNRHDKVMDALNTHIRRRRRRGRS